MPELSLHNVVDIHSEFRDLSTFRTLTIEVGFGKGGTKFEITLFSSDLRGMSQMSRIHQAIQDYHNSQKPEEEPAVPLHHTEEAAAVA